MWFSGTCMRKASQRRGQSSVEAAFALPVLLVLVLLLLQPGVLLYDMVVMRGAAAEGCRLLATAPGDGYELCEDFIRRRLGAIPELDQFHVHSGGCTWRIELAGGEAASAASVSLTTEVRPLPLLDGAMAFMGMTNAGGNLELSTRSEQQVQPDWIDGVADGRDPAGWVGI